MKKLLILVGIIVFLGECKAQSSGFPTTDSMKRYNNRFIGQTAVTAFTNLRLNTLLYGIISWIDTARLGAGGSVGVDSIYAVTDSTIRYRKNGIVYNKTIKGVYDSRRKVDSIARFNDSTLLVVINGQNRYVNLPGGNRVTKVNDSTIAINGDTVRLSGGGSAIVRTKNPITKIGDSVALTYDPVSLLIFNNGLASKRFPFNSISAARAAALPSDTTAEISVNGFLYKYRPSSSAADDSATTFISGGKRFEVVTEILTPRMFGAGYGGDDTWPFQKMFNYVFSKPGKYYNIKGEGRTYQLNATVYLPGLADATRFTFDGEGAVIYSNINNKAFFSRIPVNDATAQVVISTWKGEFKNTIFSGNNLTGSIALDLGAGYGWSIHDNSFNNFDTCVKIRFFLGSRVCDNSFSNPKKIGLWMSWGDWPGGGRDNDAINTNVISGNLFHMPYTAAHSAITIFGGNKNLILHNTVEGNKPEVELEYNFSNSNVSVYNEINDFYSETVPGTLASNTTFRLAIGSGFRIHNVTTSYKTVLFDFNGSSSGATLDLEDIKPFDPEDTAFVYGASYLSAINITGASGLPLFNMMKNPAHWKGNALPLGVCIGYQAANGVGLTLWAAGGCGVNINKGLDVGAEGGVTVVRNPFYSYNESYFNNNVFVVGSSLFMISGAATSYKQYGNEYIGRTYPDSSILFSWNTPYTNVGGGLFDKLTNQGRHIWGSATSYDQGDSLHLFYGSAHITGSLGVDFRSGYTQAIPYGSLQQWDFVPKQYVDDKVASVGATVLTDGNTIDGDGTFGNLIRGDTTTLGTQWGQTLINIRIDSLLNNFPSGPGGGLDTVARGGTLVGNGRNPANKLDVDTAVIATKSDVANIPSGGNVSGNLTNNILPIATGLHTIADGPLSSNGTRVQTSQRIEENSDKSGGYNSLSLVNKTYVDNLVAGISGGSTGDIVVTTISAFRASSSLNTTKLYFISDLDKEGIYRFDANVANNSTDDQGKYLVNATNQRFIRYSPDGSINVQHFVVGAITDAFVPNGTVDTAQGTDWGPAVNAARRAAAAGQRIIVPARKIVFHSEVDTIKAKRVVMDWYCPEIHTNKRTIFRIYPPTSAPFVPQNVIKVEGVLIGKENIGAHSVSLTTGVKSTPNWAAMAGAGFELGNVISNQIEFNIVQGFYYGTLIKVSAISAGSFGAQQNSFAYTFIDRCAVGNGMISTNGPTFCDKNWYTGRNGGEAQVDAGLWVKVEGNGTDFQGQFAENYWVNQLAERLDSGIYMYGACYANKFVNCPFEGGAGTGFISQTYPRQIFKIKSTGTYFARHTQFESCGLLYTSWLNGASLGVNGVFTKTPIYIDPGGIYVGSEAVIDATGNFVVQKTPTLYKNYSDALPPIVKLINDPLQLQEDVTVNITPYTVAVGVRNVIMNVSGGTVNLPTANINVKRYITVKNLSTNSTVNVPQADVQSVGPLGAKTFYSNGVNWYSMDDGNQAAAGNIYTIDGSLTGNRNLTQGNFGLTFNGAGDFNKYGGIFRVTGSTLPTTGDKSTKIFNNIITGQQFGGGAWNNASIELGTAGNQTTLRGTVTMPDAPLGYQYGGLGLSTLGTAGQVPRVKSDLSGLEYYTPASGGSVRWEDATPTVSTGPGGVSGVGSTVSLSSGSTNGGGRITITTGSSALGGSLVTGQLLSILFSTANGSSSNPKVVFFAGNAAAAALFQNASEFASTGSNAAGLELNGSGGSLSTTYIFNYTASQ